MSQEIQIEIGKFYKLRNGQRAAIFQILYGNVDLGEYFGAIRDFEGWCGFQWFITGKVNRVGESPLDIVGEWSGPVESDSCFGPVRSGEFSGCGSSGASDLGSSGKSR